jgi:hypothetical protein
MAGKTGSRMVTSLFHEYRVMRHSLIKFWPETVGRVAQQCNKPLSFKLALARVPKGAGSGPSHLAHAIVRIT